jgi:hypothetical protein
LTGDAAGEFASDIRDACPSAEVGVVLHCSYLGRLHDRDKKQQRIDTAKADFDTSAECPGSEVRHIMISRILVAVHESILRHGIVDI